MLVGQRIKELRIEKGISQQELGDLIGVTKVSICGYENGTRIPSLEIFETIANVFEDMEQNGYKIVKYRSKHISYDDPEITNKFI